MKLKLELIHKRTAEPNGLSESVLRVIIKRTPPSSTEIQAYDPLGIIKTKMQQGLTQPYGSFEIDVHPQSRQSETSAIIFNLHKTFSSPMPTAQQRSSQLILIFQANESQLVFFKQHQNLFEATLSSDITQTLKNFFENPLHFQLTIDEKNNGQRRISTVQYKVGNSGNLESAYNSSKFDFAFEVDFDGIKQTNSADKSQAKQVSESSPLITDPKKRSPRGGYMAEDPTIPGPFEDEEDSGICGFCKLM